MGRESRRQDSVVASEYRLYPIHAAIGPRPQSGAPSPTQCEPSACLPAEIIVLPPSPAKLRRGTYLIESRIGTADTS